LENRIIGYVPTQVFSLVSNALLSPLQLTTGNVSFSLFHVFQINIKFERRGEKPRFFVSWEENDRNNFFFCFC